MPSVNPVTNAPHFTADPVFDQQVSRVIAAKLAEANRNPEESETLLKQAELTKQLQHDVNKRFERIAKPNFTSHPDGAVQLIWSTDRNFASIKHVLGTDRWTATRGRFVNGKAKTHRTWECNGLDDDFVNTVMIMTGQYSDDRWNVERLIKTSGNHTMSVDVISPDNTLWQIIDETDDKVISVGHQINATLAMQHCEGALIKIRRATKRLQTHSPPG